MEDSNKAADCSVTSGTPWKLTFNKDQTVTSDPPLPKFDLKVNKNVDLTFENHSGGDIIMGIIASGRGHTDDTEPTNSDLVNLNPNYAWIPNGELDSGIIPIKNGQAKTVHFMLKTVAVGHKERQSFFHYACFVIAGAAVAPQGGHYSGQWTVDGWSFDPHVIIN